MRELKFHGDSIVMGRGSIDYIKKLPIKKAFIVTGGSSAFKNGAIDKIKGFVEESGGEVFVFSGIKKNPATDAVLEGLERMREFRPDTVIGVGGGSPIDAAKVMSLFYDYPGIDFDYAVKNPLPEKRKSVKFIAVPTTSGTATEVTKAAVITFKEQNRKVGLKTIAFVPDVAILDPELTLSMPKNVVAETGMDAMTHAVECYINKGLDDFTEIMSAGAAEGLFKYLPLSYKTGNIEYREKVHNYQCMAGCAFTNVGLGMAHGISHAIGAAFDMGHGLINAVALPYVLQFNRRDEGVREKLDYLAARIGSKDFVEAIKELNRTLNIPSSFKDMGISEKEFKDGFETLVDSSMKGSTTVNPVKVSRDDMVMMLRSIYEGRDIE
jgi:Alcohol dehydrogenase, class IV